MVNAQHQMFAFVIQIMLAMLVKSQCAMESMPHLPMFATIETALAYLQTLVFVTKIM